MTNEQDLTEKSTKKNKNMKSNGVCGGIYGMAFIGAAIYFIQHASSFWAGVFGILKAIIWPATVMYKVLELLNIS